MIIDLVVASRGGAAAHPDGYQNLVAQRAVPTPVMADRVAAADRLASSRRARRFRRGT